MFALQIADKPLQIATRL